MVDTTERFFPSLAAHDTAAMENIDQYGELAFSAEPASSGPMEAYALFAGSVPTGPAQRPEWLDAWSRNVNPDCILAIARQDGGVAFAMPLEIVRQGPFRVARTPGGSHANGSFFAATPAFHRSPHIRTQLAALFRAVAAVRPDIDIIALERLMPSLDGFDNPLRALPHAASPNVALAVDLGGGFEPLVDRMSGKRKRKKYRSQLRKFEAAGGYRCIRAGTAEEVNRLLSALFAMKQERFRKMGVADVFGPAEIKAFFGDLFGASLNEPEPRFQLSGLEVGGKLRAVAAYSRAGERIVCDFASFAEDELYAASPGEFLFFHDIEQACTAGMKIFDFSVGDEPYKRAWCEIETRQFDVLVALTAKGHIAVAVKRATGRAKSLVKNSPIAWRLARMVRAKGAAKPGRVEDDKSD
jgi:CelD/BcsL family acetyltransferase involved in cellulose biosynthesis